MNRIELGEYIVADPRICHGKLTFKGTRIFVEDVLGQVAQGMDWNAIMQEWRGSIPKEAIAEAVHLAGQALKQEAEQALKAEAAG